MLLNETASGPLAGLKVLEVEGTGGSPYAAMLLADMGAEVVRIERLQGSTAEIGGTNPGSVTGRGRSCVIGLDLKRAEGLSLLLDLATESDVLIEAFRPGVAERLGFGPDIVRALNPRIIYGRLTGWGRDGPLSQAAGHDINFVALAGLLGQTGRKGQAPTPPLAIGGDMAGGGLFLAFGILAALIERQTSGRGQTVDAAMVDGAASLMGPFWGYHAQGLWSATRESNLTDGGAPMYDTYECKDGEHVAIGALEPRFYALLKERIGLADEADPLDPANWPRLRESLRAIFLSKTSTEWRDLLEGTDACFAPVLNFATAPEHPHLQARKTLIDLDGVRQPAPTPRLSRTPGQAKATSRGPMAIEETLRRWRVAPKRLEKLTKAGVLDAA